MRQFARPTDVIRTPDSIKALSSLADEFKLYNLVWRRFVASFYGAGGVRFDPRPDQCRRLRVRRQPVRSLLFPGYYAVMTPREEKDTSLPEPDAGERSAGTCTKSRPISISPSPRRASPRPAS